MRGFSIVLKVWVLAQLALALAGKGKVSPIILDPLLYQAMLAILALSFATYLPAQRRVNTLLSWLVVLVPVGFLFPYLPLLQYFVVRDYLLIAVMVMTAGGVLLWRKKITG